MLIPSPLGLSEKHFVNDMVFVARGGAEIQEDFILRPVTK